MFSYELPQKTWRPLLSGSLALVLACGAFAPAVLSAPDAAKTPTKAALRADVKVELQAFRVVRENGVEKLVLAEQAKPGDVIEYQVRFRNMGNAPAKNLKPVLPIPEALVYLSNSAKPVQVFASTDKEKFAPAPLQRRVKTTDGSVKVVAVPLEEYRALRWHAGTLSPGESVLVKARAKVAG